MYSKQLLRGTSASYSMELFINDVAIPFSDGDTVYFTVKKSTVSSDFVLQKVITIFDDGKAIIELLPEDTYNLPVRGYKYDVLVKLADGKVLPLVEPSDFEILSTITRMEG